MKKTKQIHAHTLWIPVFGGNYDFIISASFIASFILIIYWSKWKGIKLVTISLVEFVLEFHPVQTQGMQESTKSFHHQQNTDSHENKDNEADKKDKNIVVAVAHVKHNVS